MSKKRERCLRCPKVVDVLPNGRLRPHIVHKGKQCLGGGMTQKQAVTHRKMIKNAVDARHSERGIK